MAEKQAEKDGNKKIHAGHRQRMWERVLKDSAHSFGSFQDHELLEMLLYYVHRQRDTNPIAHSLINEFGTLGMVFDAPLHSLETSAGCGRQSALLIKLCREIAARCQREEAANRKGKRIRTSEEAAAFFRPLYIGRQREVVMAVFLDNGGGVLGEVEFPPGQTSVTNLDVRGLVQRAFALNASVVILAHNHPGGQAYPSEQDIAATASLRNVLKHMNIQLADHLVFGAGGESCSVREYGQARRPEEP